MNGSVTREPPRRELLNLLDTVTLLSRFVEEAEGFPVGTHRCRNPAN